MPGPHQMYPIELNEQQVKELIHLSLSYTRPYYQVQRPRILLLAHQQPDCRNSQIGVM